MLATISIGFIITILIFGCYVKSNNYRTRNYRISVWHYLMTSNESAGNPPEPTTEHVDTCKPPQSDKDTFEMLPMSPMSPTASTTDTKDGEMECDDPSPGAKVPPDTTVPPKEIENEPELPQNQENKELIVDMELENITTQDVNTSEGAIEDETSKVISKPIDSPTGTESVPDEKEVISTEKHHDDDDEREWTQVKGSNKVPKSGKKESGASKGASKESATDNSPTRELRSTKKKMQKEWENFVKSLSKELQKLMGGYWATEDTERYVNLIGFI